MEGKLMQIGHLLFSLVWPDTIKSPGAWWMQTNMIACSVKYSCWYWSHIHAPSFQSFAISSMSGYRNTSISMPACFGPWIKIDNIRYFLLWHNHVGMLYIMRMTGHVLCMVLFSQNGFIPLVLKANLIFLLYAANFGYWRSIFFHWVPSVGCQNPHHFPYASQNASAPVLHP
jgi:hypothetical protein